MMDTLGLVRADMVPLAIMNVLCDAGFEVISADRNVVRVMGGCLPVEVSWGMCSCHGGRIWLDQNETMIHIELSSAEYDTDKGIDSPETELAWRIDNEVVPTVEGFSRYVHVVDTYGNYNMPDKHERRYFDSAEKASAFIFDEGGHEVTTTDTVTHQYPNPKSRLRTTCYSITYTRGDGDKALKASYRCERLQEVDGEFETEYEFRREYWMYNKGSR
jgi:hypothetical protein